MFLYFISSYLLNMLTITSTKKNKLLDLYSLLWLILWLIPRKYWEEVVHCQSREQPQSKPSRFSGSSSSCALAQVKAGHDSACKFAVCWSCRRQWPLLQNDLAFASRILNSIQHRTVYRSAVCSLEGHPCNSSHCILDSFSCLQTVK